MRPVLDMEWNERNRRAALRMVGEIREKIRYARFDPADYFPEYRGLHSTVTACSLSTFRDYARVWLRSLGQKAAATREDYRKALDLIWLDELGERPIKSIRYSELMMLIGNVTVAGKTLNNYLIPLRGVFEFARRDGAIDTNPAAGIENAPVQKPADPFTLPEVETILDNLAEREDNRSSTTSRPRFSPAFGRPSRSHYVGRTWTSNSVRFAFSGPSYVAKPSQIRRPIWSAMSSLATALGPPLRPSGHTPSSLAKRSLGTRPPANPGPTFNRNGESGSAA